MYAYQTVISLSPLLLLGLFRVFWLYGQIEPVAPADDYTSFVPLSISEIIVPQYLCAKTKRRREKQIALHART